MSSQRNNMNKKVKLLNIEIDNLTCEELLKQLNFGILVTQNVDQIVKIQSDKNYYEIVKRAEWVICDSRILLLCSKLTRTPLKEAIPDRCRSILKNANWVIVDEDSIVPFDVIEKRITNFIADRS